MIVAADIPLASISWRGAVRIIRSVFPPIDLFEDIADPADWPLLISAEQKTNPRLMETIGNLDLVPEARRVAGPGASYLMAPFTHVSLDRPSRFSSSAYGVLYAGDRFEVALFETIHHHQRFMARTKEPAGWTSQFREIVLDVDATLHDLRGGAPAYATALDPDDYSASQALGASLQAAGSDGVAYPSVRCDRECVGRFIPTQSVQGRHLVSGTAPSISTAMPVYKVFIVRAPGAVACPPGAGKSVAGSTMAGQGFACGIAAVWPTTTHHLAGSHDLQQPALAFQAQQARPCDLLPSARVANTIQRSICERYPWRRDGYCGAPIFGYLDKFGDEVKFGIRFHRICCRLKGESPYRR